MAATRERILDEALVLFATRGYDGTAVTDIELAAGLAAGSGGFYRHFPSKEAVLRAVVARGIVELRAPLEGEREDGTGGDPGHDLSPSPPTEDELADAVVQALTGLRARRLWIALLARIRGRFPDLEADVHGALVDGSVTAGAVGLAQVGRRSDAREVTSVMLSAIVGYHLSCDFFGREPGGVTTEEFARSLAHLVRTAD